eukprot:TRINITY_DN4325_c0_g1_i1.p1 TRINITY_DN4325_c0_g1~~TRINITY_DN4325_c0_g1_i1.p1  ORF type:complete len:272 (+),score=43.56 TRINITY_DN4325_c0_g1_i1:63-878(+)
MTAPVFISHGGGPSFYLPPTQGSFTEFIGEGTQIDLFYRNELQDLLPQNIKAILVISAHWHCEGALEVSAQSTPSLYFDYYNFPPHTYELKYECPHNVELENEVVRLLGEAQIPVKRNTTRGLDHGAFIPLSVIYPGADIPVVQLSMESGLDPEFHYQLGEVLHPLTQQGFLIMGSGQTTHNSKQSFESVTEFENWITDVACSDSYTNEERRDLVCKFLEAPSGLESHTRRPDHFIPFLVALGAAQGAKATKLNDGLPARLMAMSNFRFDL